MKKNRRVVPVRFGRNPAFSAETGRTANKPSLSSSLNPPPLLFSSKCDFTFGASASLAYAVAWLYNLEDTVSSELNPYIQGINMNLT